MEKALIVASSEKGRSVISSLMRAENSATSISTAENAPAARRMILDEEWDTIIINSPLAGDDAEALAKMAVTSSNASVLLLLRSDFLADTIEELSGLSILIVEKPLIPQLFFQSLHLAASFKAKCMSLIEENKRLSAKIEEMKFIDRAKCALIEHEHLSEAEAHRKVEKEAMDNRISRREAAVAILRSYISE